MCDEIYLGCVILLKLKGILISRVGKGRAATERATEVHEVVVLELFPKRGTLIGIFTPR